jgi:uncharacterized protein (TIGR03435 family)
MRGSIPASTTSPYGSQLPRLSHMNLTRPTPDRQLFSLAEQLGLKLEPGKGQVETLVIDHVERPSHS